MVSELQLVSKAVATRSAIQALSGVLIDASGGRINLSATDGEMSLRSSIAGDVATEGTVLAPGRLLVEVLRSLGGSEVTIKQEGSELSISSDKAQFALRPLAKEDFPKLPEAGGTGALSLPAGAVAETVNKVARAASRDETRPVLTGILVSAKGPELRMVATDSYRLSVKTTQLDESVSNDFESNVPARALQELSRIVSEIGAEQISIESQDNQIVFTVDRLTLSSRVIDGQFPNYERLLPDSFEHEIKLERNEFLTVIRRISLMAQRNAPLRLKFENGSVTVLAQTPEVGEASESLPVNYQGDSFEIGFNPQFMQDGLDSLDTEELVLKLIHPHRPGLIEGTDDDANGSFLYLIMPVRLNV